MTALWLRLVTGRSRRGAVAALAAGVCVALAPGGLCAQHPVASSARVAGTVVDTSGVPVPRATVRVLSAGQPPVISDDSGRFVIERAPVGRVMIGVRRLGYAPDSVQMTLSAGTERALRFRLRPSAFAMDTVMVNDTATGPWLATFNERRQSGGGYYITRRQIVESGAQTTADLLRRVPGVRIENGRWGPEVLFSHGGLGAVPCQPQLYVHHVAHDGPVNDFSPDDIEAMEIYTGTSTVPIELQSVRAHTCGAIVIWTREPKLGR